jgi:hypothetical protein
MRVLTAEVKIILPDGGDDEHAKTILDDMVEEASRWQAETPFVIVVAEPTFEDKEDPCETGRETTSGTLEDPPEEYYDMKQAQYWKLRVKEMYS